MKFLKSIFYRRGRLHPPYLFMAPFILGALTMLAFRLIPYMQKELQLSDPLVLGVLGLVIGWVTIWAKVSNKKEPQQPWSGEEKRQ